jgi:bifunctional ADP-heptose synthase (sugar kinase/adenylyltransferase)
VKILVIGELCEDVFVYGRAERMCPEAPVPVFLPTKEVRNPGMAGNVVENIKALMGPKDTVELWHQEEKIYKTRIVDEKSNQMIVRIDDGESSPVSAYKSRVLSSNAVKEIKEFDLVIVSDYNKGFLPDEALMEIGAVSKMSFLDTKKPLTKTIVSLYTFVKLNRSEAELSPTLASSPNVIVTLGREGARINGVTYSQDDPRETIDVSGAGDTFIAAFALMYAETKNVEQSITWANQMAGLVVGKRGVATP